jgi:ribose 5-phosphate isomerase B
MAIVLGSDHGGYELKQTIAAHLQKCGVPFEDFGVFSTESADYPDIAVKVAEAVSRGEFEQGILFCGTGVGISIAANKVSGIRAALCHDTYSARMSREHNDANILAMGGRVIGPGLAALIVDVWLKTGFAGGRHARRVGKIVAYEQERKEQSLD